MKFKITVCLVALGLWSSVNAQTLNDSFNDGVIDTSLWNTFYTSFGNSSLTESSGNIRFGNGAWLTTTAEYPNASISGRFSIAGWEYDRFKILLRSDGTTVESHWQNRNGGIGIQFTSSADPDYGSSQTLQLWNFQTTTLLASASPTISMNTSYDFLITDSGNEISVFLNNSPIPVLSYQTSAHYGDYIEFGNREQAAGSGPPPYYINLDSVTITSAPEPTALSLTGIGLMFWILKRTSTKQRSFRHF